MLKGLLSNSIKNIVWVIAVLTALVGPISVASAQTSLTQDACPVMGGSATSASGASLSFSIGQTCFLYETSPLGSLSEGVLQVFCESEYDTLDLSFCQNEASTRLAAILPAGFMYPAMVNPDEAGYYEFFYRGLSRSGCDSVVLIRLTVRATRDSVFMEQTEDSYVWFGENLTESGTYTHLLQTTEGCDSMLFLNLSVMKEGVPIPKIYGFQSRLLMVDCLRGGTDTIDYGYYRWYRDGELVAEGADMSTYFEDGAILSGCYYVEVATDRNMTHWAWSNTICFDGPSNAIVGAESEAYIPFTLQPNPVSQGGVAYLRFEGSETLLMGARVSIYNIHGQRVSDQAAMASTVMRVDFPSGIYSVHLLLSNGSKYTKKLIVK